MGPCLRENAIWPLNHRQVAGQHRVSLHLSDLSLDLEASNLLGNYVEIYWATTEMAVRESLTAPMEAARPSDDPVGIESTCYKHFGFNWSSDTIESSRAGAEAYSREESSCRCCA